jgi:uncharacterized protein
LPQISFSGAFSAATAIVPDLYINVEQPGQGVIQPASFGLVGIEGVASWGPVNKTSLIGSPAQLALYGTNPVNRANDLVSAAVIVLQAQQAAGLGANMLLNRVTDGTDTAASSIVETNGLTLTSLYTGSAGNSATWALAAGSNSTSGTPTWRLTLQMPNFPVEVFDNIGAGLTGNPVWVAIAAAVNNGNSPLRGPSQLMVATAGASVAAPTAATGTLSSGTDGTSSVTSAKFVGTDTAPRTGIYAFRSSGVSDLFIADFDDETQETNFIAFGQSEGILVHTNGTPGETPTTAQTAKQTEGSFGPAAAWMKRWLGDWVYWNDNYNGVQRLMGPATFGVAVNSTLQPQQSPLNKQAYGVQATQRTKSGIPYGSDELAVLTSAGIDVITNPIPAGSIFGVRIGCNASAQVTTYGDEWSRLTSFIARSLAGGASSPLGSLVGQDITADFFTEGYDMLDAFLSGLQNPGPGSAPLIQAYKITFSMQNNPTSQTARGVVVAQVLVQFLGIARIFLVNMTTGATVVIPANANAQAAAAALAA